MNYPAVFRVIGVLLVLEAIFMLPACGISLYYGELAYKLFLDAILFCLVIGFLCIRIHVKEGAIRIREGLAVVALGWVVFSIAGAFPLVWSNSVPSMTDAFFEAVSGFTTTGATVIGNVEALPKGILFWRSFTHWIGGMGILVFTVAILPAVGIGGFQMFRAEAPGPTTDRITPRINDTARILYTTYIIMTLVEIVLLMNAGMNFFDASIHTFGTVGTGGFSSKNASIGYYDNPAIHWIIGVFMVLASCNFSLYYALFRGKWRDVLKDQELRFYLGVILAATVLIGLSIHPSGGAVGKTLRDSFFQVATIISTTGYATVDFDQWPSFAKMVLFGLMFIGGCAGSTGGGIKGIRILLLMKLVRAEIVRMIHPRAVINIRILRRTVPVTVMSTTTAFFFVYMLLFAFGALLVSFEGVDMLSALSASAACIGNIGPGFGAVGPMVNYSQFTDVTKMGLSALMLLGRLEIFTVLAVLTPGVWQRD